MKITGVKITQLEWQRMPYHWRDGILPGGPTARGGLLEIFTDTGITGYSTCGGMNLDEVKYQILGQDPLNIERIWQGFWRNLRTSNLGFAIGPVDCALWDIAGKAASLPVYRLLGGMRDAIPAYASTLTLDSIEEYLSLADRCLAKGYKAIKLHAWGRLDQDAALCKALRQHVGADITLMYDTSSMFNMYEDALWFGRRLEEQNYYWYEEPMDHFNLTVLARLAAELDIPLAVAEATHGGPFDALSHIRAGAGDIILTGPLDAFKGGITGVMKTAHICEAFGVLCAIHGSAIAHLHTACAIYNSRFFECIVPEGHFGIPGIHEAAKEIHPDGTARPWDKPGLGYEIDWEWVKGHTVGIIE